MRLTKHIAEDLGLEIDAKGRGVRRRPSLCLCRDACAIKEQRRTSEHTTTLRAIFKALIFRWQ